MNHKWLVFSIVSVVGLFLDWYTKFLAQTRLIKYDPVPVISDFFQFFLVYNKGALFGMNPRSWFGEWFPTNIFFLVFSIIALVFLFFYYRSLRKDEVFLHWGLAFVVPGALGNMLDRIIRPDQGVVDFLKMGISEEIYWPIFNFADIYVTVGVGLILLSYFTEGRRSCAEAVKEPSEPVAVSQCADNCTPESSSEKSENNG